MLRNITVGLLLALFIGSAQAENVIVPTVVAGVAGDLRFRLSIRMDNLGEKDVELVFEAFDNAGDPADLEWMPENLTVPAGRIEYITPVPVDPETLFEGWIRCTAESFDGLRIHAELMVAGREPPTLIPPASVHRGAVPVQVVQHGVFFRAAADYTLRLSSIVQETALSVVNPNDTAAQVKLSYLELIGDELVPFSTTLELGPRQRIARYLGELIPESKPIVIIAAPLSGKVLSMVTAESIDPIAIGAIDILGPEFRVAPGRILSP